MTVAAHFWEFVAMSDIAGACWEWQRGKSADGYGAVVVAGRQVKAHRFAYEWAYGPVPDGLYVCHHCDNKSCVRPNHLYAGTASQNTRDAVDRGRLVAPWTGKKRPDVSGDRSWQRRMPELVARGERSGRSKLTEEQVRSIRALAGVERQVDVASQFGVHQSVVSAIQRRKTWAHVA